MRIKLSVEDIIHKIKYEELSKLSFRTVRAHRCGGFTKDYIYLTDHKKIYDYYKRGNDLNFLLTRKVTLEYVNEIKLLIEKGLAVPSKHITNSYEKNSNTNKTVGFIL